MPLIKSVETPRIGAFSINDIEQEAAALLEGARRRAAAIIEAARTEAEQQRQAAHDAGVEQGRQIGHREGVARGEEEGREKAYAEHREAIAALAQSLEGILNAFSAERESLATRAGEEVTQLAIAIANRICKRAAEIDPRVCELNVESALRLVVKSHDVKLHVHPADHDHIRQLLPAIGRKWPALTHIELVEDLDVDRGGCRVLTEGGLVDADLRTQLDRVSADLIPASRTTTDPSL